jgi:DNA-binding protein H-NS
LFAAVRQPPEKKSRDLDAELKAFSAKARELKTRKVRQLGELVIGSPRCP